jgi:hypothetical protein
MLEEGTVPHGKQTLASNSSLSTDTVDSRATPVAMSQNTPPIDAAPHDGVFNYNTIMVAQWQCQEVEDYKVKWEMQPERNTALTIYNDMLLQLDHLGHGYYVPFVPLKIREDMVRRARQSVMFSHLRGVKLYELFAKRCDILNWHDDEDDAERFLKIDRDCPRSSEIGRDRPGNEAVPVHQDESSGYCNTMSEQCTEPHAKKELMGDAEHDRGQLRSTNQGDQETPVHQGESLGYCSRASNMGKEPHHKQTLASSKSSKSIESPMLTKSTDGSTRPVATQQNTQPVDAAPVPKGNEGLFSRKAIQVAQDQCQEVQDYKMKWEMQPERHPALTVYDNMLLQLDHLGHGYYVPFVPLTMREGIISRVQQSMMFSHLRGVKLYEMLAKRCAWPGMWEDILNCRDAKEVTEQPSSTTQDRQAMPPNHVAKSASEQSYSAPSTNACPTSKSVNPTKQEQSPIDRIVALCTTPLQAHGTTYIFAQRVSYKDNRWQGSVQEEVLESSLIKADPRLVFVRRTEVNVKTGVLKIKVINAARTKVTVGRGHIVGYCTSSEWNKMASKTGDPMRVIRTRYDRATGIPRNTTTQNVGKPLSDAIPSLLSLNLTNPTKSPKTSQQLTPVQPPTSQATSEQMPKWTTIPPRYSTAAQQSDSLTVDKVSSVKPMVQPLMPAVQPLKNGQGRELQRCNRRLNRQQQREQGHQQFSDQVQPPTEPAGDDW